MDLKTNQFYLRLFLLGISVSLLSPGYADEPAQRENTKLVSRIKIKSPKSPAEIVEGYVIAEGLDGGCLMQEASGRLRVVVAKESLSTERTNEPFSPFTMEQMSKAMLQELPKGFRTTSTKHYLICYNTTDAYAKWNASLYERFFRGFYTYWKRMGIELHEPKFPLVAVIFETRDGYLAYAQREEIANAESMIGYYNLLSNRMAGYDLTGIEGLIPPGKNVATSDLVNHILAQPTAERSVATVVHEAVHQLAYNSGLQTRLADNPIAISEGLAMFFESPDLSSASGWGGIGKINRYNYTVFRNAFPNRQPNSLIKLIQDDTRFHDAATASVAYGESWALTYYLMKAKSKEFAAYLTELRERPPLQPTDPKRRMADFRKHFGEDLEKLDREFIKYMSRL
jgi:hypothetical protein